MDGHGEGVGGLIHVKSVLQSNDDFGGRDDDLYRLSVRRACGDGERVGGWSRIKGRWVG